ncbi:MAG: YciI family protein [Pseudomonadota bacterium]
MPHYHVVGRDHPGEPERRAGARAAHLAMAKRLMQEGTLIQGGALLDEAGEMIGSMLIIKAESREALDAILAADPYVQQNVFQKIEITEYRPAPCFASA